MGQGKAFPASREVNQPPLLHPIQESDSCAVTASRNPDIRFPSKILDLIPFSWRQIFERNIQTSNSFTARFRMAKSEFHVFDQYLENNFLWLLEARLPCCTGSHRNNILVLDCNSSPSAFAKKHFSCFLPSII